MVNLSFDGLLDDYLRVITRTRPWTTAEEAAYLTRWRDWLQAADPASDSDIVRLSALAQQWSEQLDDNDRAAAERSTSHFLAWLTSSRDA